jgi:hypothetical protein
MSYDTISLISVGLLIDLKLDIGVATKETGDMGREIETRKGIE